MALAIKCHNLRAELLMHLHLSYTIAIRHCINYKCYKILENKELSFYHSCLLTHITQFLPYSKFGMFYVRRLQIVGINIINEAKFYYFP